MKQTSDQAEATMAQVNYLSPEKLCYALTGDCRGTGILGLEFPKEDGRLRFLDCIEISPYPSILRFLSSPILLFKDQKIRGLKILRSFWFFFYIMIVRMSAVLMFIIWKWKEGRGIEK